MTSSDSTRRRPRSCRRSPADWARIVREHQLPCEALPTEALKHAAVWDALLDDMPIGAMIRCLAPMTAVGLLTPNSDAVERVVGALGDEGRLRKARVHPIAVLAALSTYCEFCEA